MHDFNMEPADVIEVPGLLHAPISWSLERGSIRPTLILDCSTNVLAALVLQYDQTLQFSRMDASEAREHLEIEVDFSTFKGGPEGPFQRLTQHVRHSFCRVDVDMTWKPMEQGAHVLLSRRPPDDIRSGTWLHWARMVEPLPVEISLVLVVSTDTLLSHGRWRADVNPAHLPDDLSWLSTGRRAGLIGRPHLPN